MIIIFEGPDAGGKDFVRAAFEKETKYEHTVVSRFMISQIVYARYFKRDQWMKDRPQVAYDRMVRKFLLEFKPLVVYCHADTAVLEERIRRRGESVDAQPDADKIKALFDDTFTMLRMEKQLLRLDTSMEPDMEELVARITGKVKSMEKR